MKSSGSIVTDAAKMSVEAGAVPLGVDVGGPRNEKSLVPSSSSFPPLPQRPEDLRRESVAPETRKDRLDIGNIVNRLNLDGLKNKDKDKVVGRETYATGLDVDTSIDELIYNLVEVRNLNRPDLPKLVNPLRDGLAVVPPPDPNIPPKRGRGRPPKYPRVVVTCRLDLRVLIHWPVRPFLRRYPPHCLGKVVKVRGGTWFRRGKGVGGV